MIVLFKATISYTGNTVTKYGGLSQAIILLLNIVASNNYSRNTI